MLLKIPYQQFLVFLTYMNTFFETKTAICMYSQRCEPQQIYKKLLRSNIFFSEHVILETLIVWRIKCQTRILIYLLATVSFRYDSGYAL